MSTSGKAVCELALAEGLQCDWSLVNPSNSEQCELLLSDC